MRDRLMMRDMARAYEGVIMSNNDKIKADVAKVNELFNNFNIKQNYFFEGKIKGLNCLEYDEKEQKIKADYSLPYALGDITNTYTSLVDVVDELVKKVTEIDVKTMAQENLVDYSCNPNNTELLTLESEMEEITFIQSQILTLCKIIGNLCKVNVGR